MAKYDIHFAFPMSRISVKSMVDFIRHNGIKATYTCSEEGFRCKLETHPALESRLGVYRSIKESPVVKKIYPMERM